MKNVKEEMLLAKLKSKVGKQPTAITGTVNPHNSTNAMNSLPHPTATTGGNGHPGPSAMTGGNGSMPSANLAPLSDVLKTIKLQEKIQKPKLTGEVDFGPTEVHSPIKEYMKKKGK